MRDELINIRSNEPDEGITGTGRWEKYRWSKLRFSVPPCIGWFAKLFTFVYFSDPHSGEESGIDDEYERIVIMNYEKELEAKFGNNSEYHLKNLQNIDILIIFYRSGKPKARDPLPSVPPPTTTRRRQRRFCPRFLIHFYLTHHFLASCGVFLFIITFLQLDVYWSNRCHQFLQMSQMSTYNVLFLRFRWFNAQQQSDK